MRRGRKAKGDGMNLAKLWFWEFGRTTDAPYDIVVAPDKDAAVELYLRYHTEHGPAYDEAPVRMERGEVEAAKCCIPLYVDDANDHDYRTCAKWLEEIEAAQKREAYEAELAAKQVELFR